MAWPADRAKPLVVVVDLDDTVYLERDYVASGFASVDRFVRRRYGVTGFGAAAWRRFRDGRRGDTFDRTLASLGIEPLPGRVAELVRVYREHRPEIRMLPDARCGLDDLRRIGIGIAVLTDGPSASQAAKLAALGLPRYASHVVLTASYGVGYGKPHPRGFREIAERSGAARFAYVADNPIKDFVAPHELGWLTVRVRRRSGLHVALPSGPDVDITVADMARLLAILVAWPG